MLYTQESKLIKITTPLGKDALLLQGLAGSEGISRLFKFDLELLSESDSISFTDIVGQNVTISIELFDGSERHFNGYISRFAQSGKDARFTHYHAVMVPWPWFLTRNADCRIFQDMTAPDIVANVFRGLGFQDFENRLRGSYDPVEYCVQYRETHFNFVSRLLEQSGIFYFFEHSDGKHTLVLADANGVFRPFDGGQGNLRCDLVSGGVEEEDQITSWHTEQELRAGKCSLTDYNFEAPSTSLLSSEPTIFGVGNNSKYEIYDYPGEYGSHQRGEHAARLRMQEVEANHLVATGASGCRAFTSGYKFNLQNHYRNDFNTSYVLTEVQHLASAGQSYYPDDAAASTHYSNRFNCIPLSVQYRPERIAHKPVVQGPQPAVVVGKQGEEIWVDKYGRVKVQFFWDRLGLKDENSSCWIRVSQPWAGKGWGSMSIPRIGQEVVVDFLEGDPDRPIITGRVYNAAQMPPYGLPGSQSISGLKSNSTPGGSGYNELSMDDAKGKEKVTIHAQYDMFSTVEHDDTQTVHNNRAIGVDGTHTETIKKDTTIKITEGKLVHDVVAGTADYHVQGAVTEKFSATQSTTVNKEILITSASASIHLEAATEIQLHTGASTLLMKSDGTIELSGVKLSISGTQEVKAGVATQTVTCDPSQVTTSGAAITSSAVGVHQISGALVKIN